MLAVQIIRSVASQAATLANASASISAAVCASLQTRADYAAQRGRSHFREADSERLTSVHAAWAVARR